MQSGTQVTPVSKKRLWAGRIITAIPVLLLLFSGVMKMLKVPSVLQGFAAYGYPEHLIPIIGFWKLPVRSSMRFHGRRFSARSCWQPIWAVPLPPTFVSAIRHLSLQPFSVCWSGLDFICVTTGCIR